jgi:Na+/melibiose symporter-like transporter
MLISSRKVTLYVGATLVLCVLTVTLVLGLALIRPEADNLPVIGVVIGVFTPIVAALLAAALKENHDAMNSRLSQLLLLTEKASLAEGKLAGPALKEPPSRED